MTTSRQILHIDDDPTFTKLVARVLTAKGFQVESLNDPTQWQAVIQKGNHRFIVSDIDMPQMNGVELLRAIKKFDSGITVMMLTGLVTVSSVVESHCAGAEYCFFKPVADFSPIITAIESTYQRLDHWRQAVAYVSADRARIRQLMNA